MTKIFVVDCAVLQDTWSSCNVSQGVGFQTTILNEICDGYVSKQRLCWNRNGPGIAFS